MAGGFGSSVVDGGFDLPGECQQHYEILTFDDVLNPVDKTGELVPNGYQGFEWNDFGVESI